MTREMAKKNGMDKGDNLAFHLIQSFKPGEVDAETAHRLGQQFAAEVLKGKYEYVISTHVDKKHIHNHIIFNAASFVDHHKYVSNKRSYHKLCRISNRICHENGLATSMPTGEKGKSYKENMEYHRGTSWKAKLRVAVDKAIWTSINYEEFLQKMQLAGYEVRQGKHLSFRAPEQKNFTYMKSLGSYYSEENVRIRLAKNRSKVKTPKHLSREARLYINISTYVTTGNREGFERWAKLNNLKEAARTLNYLTEHDITEYDVLAAQAASTASEFEKVSASIKQYEHRIEQVAALKTHIINYAKTHDTYVAYRKASPREKAAFRSAHEADLLLHEAAKRAFNDLGTKKLPTVKILQAEYADLLAKKKTAYEDFKRLRKESQELQTVKANVDALLRIEQVQDYEQEKEKNQEQGR